MSEIQKPTKIEFVATIDRVKDDVITSKEGKAHKVKVIKYERVSRDGKKEQKTATILQAYLAKAVALQGKIAELKEDQRVGMIMHLDDNGYYKLKDINLDPDHPVIAKTYSKPLGGGGSTESLGGSDDRQASIVAQSSVKAAIDVLTGKLSLDKVEETAKQIQAMVARLSRGESVKTVVAEKEIDSSDDDVV